MTVPDSDPRSDGFDLLERNYRLAVAAVDQQPERFFRIGGRTVRLRFAGPALETALTRAIAHLEVGSIGDPDLTVDDLIRTTDPAAFYGEGVELRYTASWVLVHFLLHGEDGALAPGLFRYLDGEIDGTGGPEAFYRQISRQTDELESAFRTYARKLKAR